jgi:hypothetical protein
LSEILFAAFGDGRWRSLLRAETVEDCLALDVARLRTGGVLTWTNVRGVPVASMGCELDLQDPETPSAILRYTLARTGEAVASVVRLVATCPHFGGLRRWFACPRCARRVGKLYLPPGETYFGCRTCYGLTYRSCQESHTVDLLAKARKRLAEPQQPAAPAGLIGGLRRARNAARFRAGRRRNRTAHETVAAWRTAQMRLTKSRGKRSFHNASAKHSRCLLSHIPPSPSSPPVTPTIAGPMVCLRYG